MGRAIVRGLKSDTWTGPRGGCHSRDTASRAYDSRGRSGCGPGSSSYASIPARAVPRGGACHPTVPVLDGRAGAHLPWFYPRRAVLGVEADRRCPGGLNWDGQRDQWRW